MKNIQPILIAIALFTCSFLSGSAVGQVESAQKLQVLTTFLPMQAHTSAIVGGDAIVEQLLGKDAGPHDFQFSPSDVRKLADADVLVINGVGIEEWLDSLIQRAGNKNLVIVDTSKGVKLLKSPEVIAEGFDHDHDHSHGHDHSHDQRDGMNPHTWLDPVIAQQQVKTILAAMKKADPANAEAYAKRAADYLGQLKALDAEFHSTLDGLTNKNLVTFHEAFPYLANRYNLRYVGSISEFPEKDPTPTALAALVDRIKELNIGVLFAEEGYAPELLNKIAAQSGARVSQLDTLEVGEGTPNAYLERMQKNLQALKAAFQSLDEQ